MRINEEISALKTNRSKLIMRIKECRRRLSYKEEEYIALERMSKANADSGKDEENMKRFGYLKRMKNRLEFRISTDASSLDKEKEIIRKIGEINKELDELGASVRIKRKIGLVKGDIEDYRKEILELEPKITVIDKELDTAYDGLRKVLGIERTMYAKPKRPMQRHKEQKTQQIQEINLADIAVIDKRESKD